MKEGAQKGRRTACRIWAVLCFLSLLIFTLILVSVIAVNEEFAKNVELSLYETSSFEASPRFFAFRFSDRTNREGEAIDVTEEVFAQKESAYVPLSEMPKELLNAFIAIEDKRFFEHSGVDWYRTLAAGANYLLGFSDQFGASTITQQLVKNMTGESEVTIKRKLREIFSATQLEQHFDKSQILELYLNVIHFSDNCDGVGAASQHYFSKKPEDLTLFECASIAAITNNPSYYNPIRHPEHNLSRRNLILSQMYEQGYIDESAYQAAENAPLKLSVDEGSDDGINSWYTDMVIDDVIHDLIQEYGMSRAAASRLIYTGGLRIDIAMDETIQKKVEAYYRNEMRVPTDGDGLRAQSALIVLDSRTGDILGVAGAVGEKSGNHLQNFATQTLRPPGSTIKPLSVYAPAIEEGLINWASVYDDVPVEFDLAGKSMWPKNATNTYKGLTNIAYAVAHSTNTVAVRVLQELGLEHSYRFAKERFHLEHLEERDRDRAALALGQLHHGVSLREMSAAYTAFADAGVYHSARSYYRVLDKDGNILLSRPDGGDPILSPETAAIMTKLLEGVITDGTSSSIDLQYLTDCAGKTGTTNADGDRWFIGYTPEIVMGVWCGYEYPKPLVGRNLCTKAWNDVMHRILQAGGAQKHFSIPPTLVQISYCKDSGCLAEEACTLDPRKDRVEKGWFVKGQEPKVFCKTHVLVPYDGANGVDHGFCPPEDVRYVGLLKIQRNLPKKILVKDSEYVFDGDPSTLPAQNDPTLSYFGDLAKRYGSVEKNPFNRSCPYHTEYEEITDSTDEEPQESQESQAPARRLPWQIE